MTARRRLGLAVTAAGFAGLVALCVVFAPSWLVGGASGLTAAERLKAVNDVRVDAAAGPGRPAGPRRAPDWARYLTSRQLQLNRESRSIDLFTEGDRAARRRTRGDAAGRRLRPRTAGRPRSPLPRAHPRPADVVHLPSRAVGTRDAAQRGPARERRRRRVRGAPPGQRARSGRRLRARTGRSAGRRPDRTGDTRVSVSRARASRARCCGTPKLAGATLAGADLRDADLRGADLTGADLTDARLAGVRADGATRWPAGFEPPD